MKSQLKKVFVALSGGVDSSVAAVILKEQGFRVEGVFIIIADPAWPSCTSADDRHSAMRAASHLGIPLHTIDFTEAYKRDVIDYMIREYREGRTPNPDVMCNKHIKFGAFFNWAMNNGADFIATGHYSHSFRIHQPTVATSRQEAAIHNGVYSGVRPRYRKLRGQTPLMNHFGDQGQSVQIHLARAKDEDKDQTYFLWTITQRELERTLFPIGDYTKSEVRRMARRYGLPNAERKDSQGLCFAGELNVKDFLKRYLPENRGDVLSESGEIIGFHDGVHFYTIGERHGFTIVKKGPNDPPFYIIEKDVKSNTLTVGKKNSRINSSINSRIQIKDTNWISVVPDLNKKYLARLRHCGELLPCTIIERGKTIAEIFFKSPSPTPAPGQSLVLYYNTVCLGGGVISGMYHKI